jgi:hypothetical protein
MQRGNRWISEMAGRERKREREVASVFWQPVRLATRFGRNLAGNDDNYVRIQTQLRAKKFESSSLMLFTVITNCK